MLEPMPASDVAGYLARTTESYARDLAEALGTPLVDARVRARAQVEHHLPDGPATAGHFFFRIVAAGGPVGWLWFEEQLGESPPRLFIFDIRIDAACRGQGHGTSTLREVEEEARLRGAEQVMLAVRHHNKGAVRLYERLGYEVTERAEAGQRMAIAVVR